MATVHTITLWEIGNALYRAGLLKEYEALKGYAIERSELLNKLPRERDLFDEIWDAATIEAAELVGPNSCEYEHLREQINVRMWNEHAISTHKSPWDLKAQP